MKKIVLGGLIVCSVFVSFTLMAATIASSKTQNACGGPQWLSTGQKGPYGYVWHYDSTRTSGTAPDPAHICANFYRDLNNCYAAMPTTKHGYTYMRCDYDTGIYHLIASTEASTIETYCQNC